MNWNEGYVAEIDYTKGFYSELSPCHMSFIGLFHQFYFPNLTQPFTYCEIACGQGLTTNLLAAIYPQATFYANDFNPSHISHARQQAKQGHLTNVHFFDDSFKEFLSQSLPQFDFIAIHGIYSWISSDNRLAIVEFLRKFLKPGGLVYVSYNCMPGWAAMAPAQFLMLYHSQTIFGNILNRLDNTFKFIDELLKANAFYFAQNPTLKTRFERMKGQDKFYLAHEYFNQHWQPLYFADVAKELAEAKLNYVSSAHILDLMDAVNIPPQFASILNASPDPIYRQQIRDYLLNNQFRRDIFARGSIRYTPQEQLHLLNQSAYTLIVPLESVKYEHQFTIGTTQLQEYIYRPVCEALAKESLTFAQLLNLSTLKGITVSNLFQSIVLLIGVGYVHPVLPTEGLSDRKSSTDRFNQSLISNAVHTFDINFLASPVIGSAVQINRIEQLLAWAQLNDKDPEIHVWEIMSGQGQKIIHDGKTLETPEENMARIKEVANEFFNQKYPVLQKLGIL